MANTTSVCTSFKVESMAAYHNFSGTNPARSANTADAIKAALYLASASQGAGTTVYSTSGELTGAGYTAGGLTVTNANPPVASGTAACWTPSAQLSWTGFTGASFDTATFYNSSQGNRAIANYNFGSTTITAGTFNLTMPVNAAGTALLQAS